MSRYIIKGGANLKGEVSIRGAKNASYKQIIASMLSSEKTELHNIPNISDVKITKSIAKCLGAEIIETGEHSIEIITNSIKSYEVPHGTGEKSRSSFIFSAPLLTRKGIATFPVPGGDKLGTRPLDRLYDCFEKMNIKTEESGDWVTFKTTGIKPVQYRFNKPTHTVTEVVIMTAVLTPGVSVFDNCAMEPEIDDLVEMLNSMGAKIHRDEKDPKRIVIDGVSSLNGTSHQVIADRNEAITFATAALATKGSVSILRIEPRIIETYLKTIEKMGAKVYRGRDEVSVSWVETLKSIDIETEPEPGFMTDWQAVFSVLLTQSVGCSTLIERIYPYRFHHINNLLKMGAKITLFNPEVEDPDSYYHFNKESDKPENMHGAKFYGPIKLKPENFCINDLRAGASTVVAALTAPGESVIDGVEYIERGYEKLAERLCSLGADINYIKT